MQASFIRKQAAHDVHLTSMFAMGFVDSRVRQRLTPAEAGALLKADEEYDTAVQEARQACIILEQLPEQPADLVHAVEVFEDKFGRMAFQEDVPLSGVAVHPRKPVTWPAHPDSFYTDVHLAACSLGLAEAFRERGLHTDAAAQARLKSIKRSQRSATFQVLLSATTWADRVYGAFLDSVSPQDVEETGLTLDWSTSEGGGLSEDALKVFMHVVVGMQVRRSGGCGIVALLQLSCPESIH